MRYTKKRTLKNGKVKWVFRPPKDVIEANVAQVETFDDGRTARHKIEAYNQAIDKWRKGEAAVGILTPDSNLYQATVYYLNSHDFLKKAGATQRETSSQLREVCATILPVTEAGYTKLKDVDFKFARRLCQHYLSENPDDNRPTNRMVAAMKKLMRQMTQLGLVPSNPFEAMRLLPVQRDVNPNRAWTEDELKRFLDKAFSTFQWRNIGLICFMSYEWAIPGAVSRALTWDALDLELGTVVFQRRSGYDLKLPVSKTLLDLLRAQRKDWGFQQYVAPILHVQLGGYFPYTARQLTTGVDEIKKAAGLPDNLTFNGLRKGKDNDV